MKRIVGIDIETYDPHLKEKGVSWVYGEGEILCTSLYYADTGKSKVIRRTSQEVKSLLLSEDVVLVGAKIDYDIGWLEHEHNIKGQTKAELVDVLVAEGLIDEYGRHNLDDISYKYLKLRKTNEALKEWAEEKGFRGDFRKYLAQAPYAMVKEYAKDDAELPVLVFQKQKKILEEQNLMEAFERDCKMLKIVLKMKQRGIRIDLAKKEENRKKLQSLVEKRKKAFVDKYGEVNLNSSKQVAELAKRKGVPYKVKFTIKGKGSKKYGWNDLKSAMNELSEVVTGFRRKKGTIVAFVEEKHSLRLMNTLTRHKYIYTANPNVDKNWRNLYSEDYPVVRAIQDIKQANDILNKILGDKFDRFIVNGRVHADFNVALTDEYGTISGRLSSSNPNLQQIPSKGSIFTDDGEEYSLAKMCRELFLPEKNNWLLKIDYSQIEYRLLVHYAVGNGSADARRRFIEDPSTDYHQFVMDLTNLERKYAKNCNFGIMYGMGLGGMIEAFGWGKEQAAGILDDYHIALPYVSSTMKKVSDVASKRGYIMTIGGRRARLRNKDLSYTMLNRLNQGGSADIMKEAMIKADEEGIFEVLPAHITVHDELVCSVPKTKKGIETVEKLKHIMETAIELRVPVNADPELGKNWHDVMHYTDAVESLSKKGVSNE